MEDKIERFTHYQGFDCLNNARLMNSREDIMLHELFDVVLSTVTKHGFEVIAGSHPEYPEVDGKKYKVIEFKASIIMEQK